jgi:uncharacterized membrane protein
MSDVLLIGGMSIIVFGLRIGGFWLNHFLSQRMKTELKMGSIAGALIIAMVVPAAADQGLSACAGVILAFLVAWRTKNFLLSVAAGIAAFLLAQHIELLVGK